MANETNIPLEERLSIHSTPEDFTMECGSTCTEHPAGVETTDDESSSPAVRVLSYVEEVLRQRLNLEVEEFQTSLHSIVDEQLWHVRQLVSFSQPSLSQDVHREVPPFDGNGDEEPLQQYCSQITDDVSSKPLDPYDDEKTKIVLELMTLCSSLSRRVLTL